MESCASTSVLFLLPLTTQLCPIPLLAVVHSSQEPQTPSKTPSRYREREVTHGDEAISQVSVNHCMALAAGCGKALLL